MSNMDAAREAEKEFSAQIIVIKKTSPDYAALQEQPPCPSVNLDGTFVAKNDIATFEQLKTAIQG